jgi:hypothetical protein
LFDFFMRFLFEIFCNLFFLYFSCLVNCCLIDIIFQ